MIAYLTTDASLCTETGAAAWGAVARGVKHQEFGALFPGSFGSINGVELHAIAMGLRAAIEAGIFRRGHHVIVQTDSCHAGVRVRPDYVSRRNRRRMRLGLPIPEPELANPLCSPKAAFHAMMEDHDLTWNVIISNDGADIVAADGIARVHMLEERMRRRGMTPGEAKLAAFEKVLDDGRVNWLRQIAEAE